MIKRAKEAYGWGVKVVSTGLGIDADYFLKGSFYNTIQQLVGLACGLAITYAFGHFASKSLFGEYNLVLSIVGLISIVTLPGMAVAVLRSTGEGFDSSLNRGVKARFFWSFLGIPLLLFASFYYKRQGSDVLPSLLILSAAFFPWLYAFQTTLLFFIAKKRFDLQALFTSLSSMLTATLVTSALWFNGTLGWILVGYFIGLVAPSLLSFKQAQSLAKKQKGLDRDLLPYGYFLTGVQLLPLASNYLGSILVAQFLGVSQLAVFTIATKFPGVVQKSFDVFFKPITAKLAAQSKKEHAQTLSRHLAKFGLFGILLFLPLWLLTPWLIQTLVGPQYLDAVAFSRLYAFSLLPLPLIWLLGDVVNFQKLKKPIFVLNTAFPAGRLLAYFLVISRWQITGLIAIMLAERFLMLGYYLTLGLSTRKQ